MDGAGIVWGKTDGALLPAVGLPAGSVCLSCDLFFRVRLTATRVDLA
jgi:hypothetical protein